MTTTTPNPIEKRLKSYSSMPWNDLQGTDHCGTGLYYRNTIEKNPELIEKELEREKNLREATLNSKIARSHNSGEIYLGNNDPLYQIKVFFHIVLPDPENDCPDEMLHATIEELNKNFRNTNIDQSERWSEGSLHPDYQAGRAGDSKIQFSWNPNDRKNVSSAMPSFSGIVQSGGWDMDVDPDAVKFD